MSGIEIAVIILILGAPVFFFFMSQWRLKRAAIQVIQNLRRDNALDFVTAKPIEELGIKQRGTLQTLFMGYDYRSSAMKALIQAKIVLQTEDGRVYLSESELAASSLSKSIPR